MRCIQLGCCEYQASACPRTCLPFWRAQLRIRSPLEKLNWPWLGSVASIFISFSAVIMLNSRFAMVEYVESLNRLAAMAVPKYRPLCAAASWSVEPAACAGTAARAVTPSARTAIAAAPRAAVGRRRRSVDGGVIVPPR